MTLKVQLPPIQSDKGSWKLVGPLVSRKLATAATAVTAPKALDNSARRDVTRSVLDALPDLPGMSSWLQRERPEVWARCLKVYQQCDAVWNAPLPVFEQTLVQFMTTFGEAFELYRVYLQNHPGRFLEGLQTIDSERRG